MIGRVLAAVALLLSALLASTVPLPSATVWGWRPDLVLLTVVAVALATGPDSGAVYGFCAGLARDLLSGGEQLVGLSAIVLVLLGYAVGSLRPSLADLGPFGPVLLAGVGSAAAAAGTGLGAQLLGAARLPAGALVAGALAVGLGNALLAPLVCPLVARAARRAGAVGG